MLKATIITSVTLPEVAKILGHKPEPWVVNSNHYLVYSVDTENYSFTPQVLSREAFREQYTWPLDSTDEVQLRPQIPLKDQNRIIDYNGHTLGGVVQDGLKGFYRNHKRGVHLTAGVVMLYLAHKSRVNKAAAAGFVLGEKSQLSPTDLFATIKKAPDLVHFSPRGDVAHFVLDDIAMVSLFGDFNKIPKDKVIRVANKILDAMDKNY